MFQIKSVVAEKPSIVIGIVCALLGIVFVLHTATLWWPAQAKVQNSSINKNRALEFDVERIVSSSVFSGAQTSAETNKNSKLATEARVSHSEFSLQAVFESSDENRSTVIIAKSGQAPRSYRAGDVLADGISITSIKRDRVHLDSHGQATVLTLKQQSKMLGSTVRRAADKLLRQMPTEGKIGQVKQRLEQLRRQSQEK